MSVGPSNKKQYGLIIPKGKESVPLKKRHVSSVFNLNSDEEEETAPLPTHLQNGSFKNLKRQAKIDIQRALEDDPTVYQYDEIYDNMKQEKEDQKQAKKKDKTSKYAMNLIRNAAIRKLENDRHFERKCQKELEDEGDEFADKEAFVTSSYKKKLEELAVLEEEHRKREEEDKKNDVTKKSDLTDFYRSILARRTETVAQTPTHVGNVTQKISEPQKLEQEEQVLSDSKAKEAFSKESAGPEVATKSAAAIRKILADRWQYRQRKKSEPAAQATESRECGTDSEYSDSEVCKSAVETPLANSDKLSENKFPEHKQIELGDLPTENLDKDDSNSSDESDEEKQLDQDNEKSNNVVENKNIVQDETTETSENSKRVLTEEEDKELRLKLIIEKFKKRNTADSLEAAKKRYWQRRANRQQVV